MGKKEITYIEMIEKWFQERATLSKSDFEMIKKFYWLANNRKPDTAERLENSKPKKPDLNLEKKI